MSIIETARDAILLRMFASEFHRHRQNVIPIASGRNRALILEQLDHDGGTCVEGLQWCSSSEQLNETGRRIDCWRYLFPSLPDEEIRRLPAFIAKHARSIQDLSQAHILVYVDEWYYSQHVAKVISSTPPDSIVLKSKFGFGCDVYEHGIEDVPLTYGNQVIPIVLPDQIRKFLI